MGRRAAAERRRSALFPPVEKGEKQSEDEASLARLPGDTPIPV